MNPAKELYTRKQIALLLKVSPRTISRWHLKGLPFIRMGKQYRYDYDYVEDWILSEGGDNT